MNPFTSDHTVADVGVIWIVDIAIGGVAYGIFVTLAILCLMTLRSTDRRCPSLQASRELRNQQRYLWLHVLLILAMVTFLQIWDIRRLVKAIFFTNVDDLTSFRDWSNVIIVLGAVLTDGLLVSTLPPSVT